MLSAVSKNPTLRKGMARLETAVSLALKKSIHASSVLSKKQKTASHQSTLAPPSSKEQKSSSPSSKEPKSSSLSNKDSKPSSQLKPSSTFNKRPVTPSFSKKTAISSFTKEQKPSFVPTASAFASVRRNAPIFTSIPTNAPSLAPVDNSASINSPDTSGVLLPAEISIHELSEPSARAPGLSPKFEVIPSSGPQGARPRVSAPIPNTDGSHLKFTKGMNKAQRNSVTASPDLPLLINGAPGTGKTMTLAARIAQTVSQNKTSKEVLAFGLTNEEALILERQIQQFLQPAQHSDAIFKCLTIPLFATKLLRQYGYKIGISSDFQILEGRQKLKLINDLLASDIVQALLNELGYEAISGSNRPDTADFDGTLHVFQNRKISDGATIDAVEVSLAIEKIKSQKNSISDWLDSPSADESSPLGAILSLYEDNLQMNKSLDHGDLLLHTATLLKSHPDISSNILHVFVDGYENITPLEDQFVSLLASKSGITVTGNLNQAINPLAAPNFGMFSSRDQMPKYQRTQLPTNHRSVRAITDAGQAIVPPGSTGTSTRTKLKTKLRFTLPPPLVVESKTPQLQAESISSHIKHLVEDAKGDGWKLSDFVVIADQPTLRNTAKALSTSGIPFRVVGDNSFWNLNEVQAVVNILRIIQSADHDDAVFQTLKALDCDVQSITSLGLRPHPTAQKSLLQKLEHFSNNPPKSASLHDMSVISKFLTTVRAVNASQPSLIGIINTTIACLGLEDSEVKKKSMDSLRKLVASVEFQRDAQTIWYGGRADDEILRFLHLLALGRLKVPDDHPAESVTLSTIYGARGKAWPVVFASIPGGKEVKTTQQRQQLIRRLYSSLFNSKALYFFMIETGGKHPAKPETESAGVHDDNTPTLYLSLLKGGFPVPSASTSSKIRSLRKSE